MKNGKVITGWYIRDYVCANGIGLKRKFYVPEDGKQTGYSAREQSCRIRRAEKNVTEAKVTAAMEANNNFRAGRDYFLTLTLSDEGMARVEKRASAAWADDPDAVLMAMRHELELLIDRTRGKCKKQGAALKYIAVASDMDGETGELVRPHLHIIVNREAAQLMAASWKLGQIKNNSRLRAAHYGDLTDLVEYMIGQVRQLGTEKRYKPSRNLVMPVPTRPRPVKNVDAPLRVPKGCDFIWRSEQVTGYAQSLRYHRPPRADRTGGGGR